MKEQLRTIRLYGTLGAKFGRVHRFAVVTPGEAIRALCSQIRGFERELMGSKERGITYSVFAGKRNLVKDDLAMPAPAGDIRIAPILQGSKRGGVFQTILGAVLVVVGAVAMFFGQEWGIALIKMGAVLALGGVAQMLAPTQKGLSGQDSADNQASYAFDGPVNTTVQGNPVPLLYGRMIVGSAVISAGIYAEDEQ